MRGFSARGAKLIDEAGIRGLNGFVFYFALPLMLLQNLGQAPVAEAFDLGLALA